MNLLDLVSRDAVNSLASHCGTDPVLVEVEVITVAALVLDNIGIVVVRISKNLNCVKLGSQTRIDEELIIELRARSKIEQSERVAMLETNGLPERQ